MSCFLWTTVYITLSAHSSHEMWCRHHQYCL